MIIEIEDFNDERLDIYARLSEAQIMNLDNPGDSLFIAESPKVIERALNGGYEPVSMLVETKHIDGEAKEVIARCGDIPVFTSDYDVLVNLTGYALTRGILCAMRRRSLPSLENIIKNAKNIVLLDNVMNPTNVGAIVRSAAALGADGVVFTSDCSNPLYRRAIRVSMGTIFQVPFTIIDNVDYIKTLKEFGFTVFATALKDDSVSLKDAGKIPCEKKAVIMGSEGDGLPDEVINLCDYTVKIPMFNGVDSLNVAAASAVVFYGLFA